MTQTSNYYYPVEKEPTEEVHLLVDEQTIKWEDLQPPKTQKCSFFRFLRKLVLLSLSTYALIYLCGFTFDFSSYYHESGEYVSSLFDSEGPQCNPKIPYDVNQTYEYDPKDFPSLGVYLFGNSKFSTVRFEKHDSDKVTIVPEIFISSIPVADKVTVGAKTEDGSYGFGIKGPSWFQGRDKCIKSHIVVKIPKDLESFEKIWVRLPHGSIETESLEKLTIQKLHLELGVGDNIAKNMVANQIELTTGVGKIELTDSISESVALYSRKGDIEVSKLQASRLKTGTADGDIIISVKDSVLAYAKNLNGNIKMTVESLASESSSVRAGYHFAAGTVNGHSSLLLPKSYSGRFNVATFNGEAQLVTDSDRIHYTKNYNQMKRGYLGDDAKSPSYAEATCLNGTPFLEFF